MRIALAEVKQESNTFSTLTTDLRDFERSTFLVGKEILGGEAGDAPLSGARSALADKTGVEVIPLIQATALPGGRLTRETVKTLEERLLSSLEQCLPVDGMLFSLHGATASEDMDDVCGHLLQAARRVVGERTRIVVPLDHHANITGLIMEMADLVVGHETQPHHPFSTGFKAAEHLYDLVRQHASPAQAWVKIPMIAPQDRFLTSEGPMKEWFHLARELETTPGVLSISLFPMQPWLDVAEGGWAVVVYARNDQKLAGDLACRLAEEAWRMREQFWVSDRVPIVQAVRGAVAASRGLVLLSDTGDAVYGGGTGDSTGILQELLRQKVPCLAYVPVFDSAAVEQASASGLGQQTLTIGGRHDPCSTPLKLTGRVTAISKGLRAVSQRSAVTIDRTVLFEVENIRIAIMDNRSFAVNQPLLYCHLGLEIEQAKMVVLKTGSNFQFFERWRSALIRVDSHGATQSDLRAFDWGKLPRPIFPLDEIRDWNAAATSAARRGGMRS
jgi:microcystin degradation protein MlrC